MAKLFDKISADFMAAIKGVVESTAAFEKARDDEKKARMSGEDKDKVAKLAAMMSKEKKPMKEARGDITVKTVSPADAWKKHTGQDTKKAKVPVDPKTGKTLYQKVTSEEKDMPFEGGQKVKTRKDEYGNTVKNVAKHLAKKAMKSMGEEAEQVDEKLSDEAKAAVRFAAGGGAKVKPLVKLAQMAKKKVEEEVDLEENAKIVAHLQKRYGDNIRKSHVASAAKDFGVDASKLAKAVRKKLGKTMLDEEEQIDELSKATMGRYINKAAERMSTQGVTAGLKIAADEKSKKNFDNIKKREKGIKRAVDKLTKEEIEMIEAKMAGVACGSMEGDKHMCATKVFHKEWNEGIPIKTMHADPDENGLIEWYDVLFDHGIERVMTEDMEILQQESHMHSKKKMKEEVEELDELSTNTLDSYRSKARKDIIDADANDDTETYNKRTKGYTKASQNIRKNFVKGKGMSEESEELDEARGRPKKAAAKDYTVHPKTGEKLMHNNPEHMKKIELLQKNKVIEKPKTEAGQHVINQLEKAKTSMQGGSTIHFTHGESKHVSGTHAAKLIDKYRGMKPSEKEDFQKKISHSHEEMMKHV